MNALQLRGMVLLSAAVVAIGLLYAGCGGCKTGGRNACEPLAGALRDAVSSAEGPPGATPRLPGEARR